MYYLTVEFVIESVQFWPQYHNFGRNWKSYQKLTAIYKEQFSS